MNLDEEYVRNIMCMTDGIEEHPAAKLLEGKVVRSLTNSTRFRNALATNVRAMTVKNAAGILIPNVLKMSAEGGRITRVIRKIAKGLFYHFNKRPIPDKYDVAVSPLIKREDFYTALARLAHVTTPTTTRRSGS